MHTLKPNQSTFTRYQNLKEMAAKVTTCDCLLKKLEFMGVKSSSHVNISKETTRL